MGGVDLPLLFAGVTLVVGVTQPGISAERVIPAHAWPATAPMPLSGSGVSFSSSTCPT